MSDAKAPEDCAEHFQCKVCLDLLFKPVVYSCGHVFCFWCAHGVMDGSNWSYCPLCRKSFSHFPKICEMLHCLLMRAFPKEYRLRAEETRELEVKKQIFSPRIPPSLGIPCKDDASDAAKLAGVGENGAMKGQDKASIFDDTLSALSSTSGGLKQANSPVPLRESGQEEFNVQNCSESEYQTCTGLTAEDFSCTSCKRFPYRPVVLHCGEVFCETCVGNSNRVLSCPSCHYAHSEGSVKVCLDLHHYLESAFPEIVAKRKADAIPCCPAEAIDKEAGYQKDLENQYIHHDVGCDGCGMYPIVGERYKCQDCPDLIGYDLCGTCFVRETEFCGRFNQQHTASHRMTKVPDDPMLSTVTLVLLHGSGI